MTCNPPIAAANRLDFCLFALIVRSGFVRRDAVITTLSVPQQRQATQNTHRGVRDVWQTGSHPVHSRWQRLKSWRSRRWLRLPGLAFASAAVALANVVHFDSEVRSKTVESGEAALDFNGQSLKCEPVGANEISQRLWLLQQNEPFDRISANLVHLRFLTRARSAPVFWVEVVLSHFNCSTLLRRIKTDGSST